MLDQFNKVNYIISNHNFIISIQFEYQDFTIMCSSYRILFLRNLTYGQKRYFSEPRSPPPLEKSSCLSRPIFWRDRYNYHRHQTTNSGCSIDRLLAGVQLRRNKLDST